MWSNVTESSGHVLSQIAEAFTWSDAMDDSWINFARNEMRFILPILLVRAEQLETTDLLVETVASIGVRLKAAILDHFQYIVAHLVFHCSPEQKDRIYEYISGEFFFGRDLISSMSIPFSYRIQFYKGG